MGGFMYKKIRHSLSWGAIWSLCLTHSHSQAGDWVEHAQSFCDSATLGSTVIACLKEASNAAYFEKGAIDLCNKLTMWDSAFSCFKSIKNREYSQKMLRRCDSFTTGDDMVSCLKYSGVLVAYTYETDYGSESTEDRDNPLLIEANATSSLNNTNSTESTNTSNQGLSRPNNASNQYSDPQTIALSILGVSTQLDSEATPSHNTKKGLCSLVLDKTHRKECNVLVASGAFDDKAFNLCEQAVSRSDMAQACATAIIGKNYSETEIKACKRDNAAAIIACLAQSGDAKR